LNQYLSIIDLEAQANKKIKAAIKDLDKKVIEKYKELTEEEIKSLVVDDKWMPSIISEVNGEMERISHRLSSRIKELAERYEEPLPQIEKEVDELAIKVEEHLKRMGFAW